MDAGQPADQLPQYSHRLEEPELRGDHFHIAYVLVNRKGQDMFRVEVPGAFDTPEEARDEATYRALCDLAEDYGGTRPPRRIKTQLFGSGPGGVRKG